MPKLGIKVWTRDVLKNRAFFNQAVAAVKNGEFDYIELFVFPNSYEDTCQIIKDEMAGVATIIHNSHSAYGFDAGNAERRQENAKDFRDSQKFADKLGAEIIIVHAGGGDKQENLEETIRQFKAFNDSRIAVENMPYDCRVSKKIQHGVFPAQIEMIMYLTGCQFCLDFSHAMCSANYYQRDFYETIRQFNALEPVMYHICDGFDDEIIDKHLHFGEGNYNLDFLINEVIRDDAFVTMETGYLPPVDLNPWQEDKKFFLQKLCQKG